MEDDRKTMEMIGKHGTRWENTGENRGKHGTGKR